MKQSPVRSHRSAGTVFVLLIAVAASLSAGGTAEQPEETRMPTITVVGVGELVAEPDQATITVGVQLYNQSAEEASAELRRRMESVIAGIKALGIPDRRIQTTNYSIFFERDYQTRPAPMSEDGSPAGMYRVENMVRVTITDAGRAAEVVDTAIRAGANQLHGISFSFSQPRELDARARALAVDDAFSKAQELAAAAGRSVGPAVTISELAAGGPAPYEVRGMATGMGGGPVEPGTSRYTTRVQVTYRLE